MGQPRPMQKDNLQGSFGDCQMNPALAYIFASSHDLDRAANGFSPAIGF
jgi:hypothetical protein